MNLFSLSLLLLVLTSSICADTVIVFDSIPYEGTTKVIPIQADITTREDTLFDTTDTTIIQSDTIAVPDSITDSLEILRNRLLDTTAESGNYPDTTRKTDSVTIPKAGIITHADNPKITPYSPTIMSSKITDSTTLSAAYIPGWNLVTHARIDAVIAMCKRNGFNAIMADLKNVRGELFFDSQIPIARIFQVHAKTAAGYQRTIDFDYLSKEAQKEGIKIIGRFVMFRDAKLYKAFPEWQLEPNEKWLDMTHPEVNEYLLALLNEAADLPLQEIALDYIRYPDVSGLGKSVNKQGCIEEIVGEISEALHKKDTDLSIYVFGWVAWNRKQNIGQDLQGLAPLVDIIYPMVYPSHFYSGSLGFRNPANNPYQVILQGYKAAEKNAPDTPIMPMLQVFWYKPSLILEQLKAVYLNDMPGFGCWNAAGNYKQYERALQLLENDRRTEKKKSRKRNDGEPPTKKDASGEAPHTDSTGM